MAVLFSASNSASNSEDLAEFTRFFKYVAREKLAIALLLNLLQNKYFDPPNPP